MLDHHFSIQILNFPPRACQSRIYDKLNTAAENRTRHASVRRGPYFKAYAAREVRKRQTAPGGHCSVLSVFRFVPCAVRGAR